MSKNTVTNHPDKPYQDKELLQELYLGEKLSTREIGEMFGVSHSTILFWLKKLEISTREPSKAHKGKKFTEEHRQKISEANKNLISHKLDCQCSFCKAKRGEIKGKNHPRWRGGKKIDSGGRILIYFPEHPYANMQKYVLEHRLILEESLGRPLKPEEVVHHEDGNPKNNSIENLILFPNHSAHTAYHHKKRRENKQKEEDEIRVSSN